MSDKITRSPTPPETDDDGDEWPVHGIVGEDVDVFGISSYEASANSSFLSTTLSRLKKRPMVIRWQEWSRRDGTNTTWMREIDGDPAFVASWNEATKNQRLKKATESQSIDLTLLAKTPMHDRLTFERAQAVEEKMAERLRKAPPGKAYQDWAVEIERQVALHEERGERNAPSSSATTSTVPQKRSRPPSLGRTRERTRGESSRSGASRMRSARNMRRKTAADGDFDADNSDELTT